MSGVVKQVMLSLRAMLPSRVCSACGVHFQDSEDGPRPRMVALLDHEEDAFSLVLTFACSAECDSQDGRAMALTNAAEALVRRATAEVQQANKAAS